MGLCLGEAEPRRTLTQSAVRDLSQHHGLAGDLEDKKENGAISHVCCHVGARKGNKGKSK